MIVAEIDVAADAVVSDMMSRMVAGVADNLVDGSWFFLGS